MKLKYIITCDENGVKSEEWLHYWDYDFKRWEPIDLVEIKKDEYDEYVKERG